MENHDNGRNHAATAMQWYDLFSRGARDWLRHNEKVREAVKDNLPEILSNADFQGSQGQTVRVPVKVLEHYRFQLNQEGEGSGTGQGAGEPGDVLRPGGPGKGDDKGEGGDNDGGFQLVLELKVDDIVDWLWDELKLPDLEPRSGPTDELEYEREGWDRRGARSRLDRRRSMKESIKRRAVQKDGPAFTNEDLRFRQLVKRPKPSTRAVVFFCMDVSASMSGQDRQVAKTFFFWVIQGLRRRYQYLETVFIAHTTEAWQFNEDEFFQVRGSGGTVASTAFARVSDLIESDYDPARYNLYLFYASDGANFAQDREPASKLLMTIGGMTNFTGYLEIQDRSDSETEMTRIVDKAKANGLKADRYAVSETDHIWDAIRAFFYTEAQSE